MNLLFAERRRVSVSDMRGYQMKQNDNDSVLLYSFEVNAVYDDKIDKQFNKIVVQSLNHKFSDTNRPAVFDNPFESEHASLQNKLIIFDFYYNMFKNILDSVELLGQNTDSLIVQLSDKGNIVHKLFEMYKSFDFLELDNTSYFSRQFVNYYEQNVDKSKYCSLLSIFNYDKKLSEPIFKNNHNGNRITEFVRLRFKMHCLVDEKDVTCNAERVFF